MSDDFSRAFAGSAVTTESERQEAIRVEKVKRILAAMETARAFLEMRHVSSEQLVQDLFRCCQSQQALLELFLSEFACLRTAGISGPRLYPGLREYFDAKPRAEPTVDAARALDENTEPCICGHVRCEHSSLPSDASCMFLSCRCQMYRERK